MNMLKRLLIFSFLSVAGNLFAQRSIQINAYGHFDYKWSRLEFNAPAERSVGTIVIGEHDLFVTGNINDRLSFLGEVTVTGSGTSSTGFQASIERARLKYNYKGNHSLLFGKMHTAINYWNDVFHHGRLFFPTIDRPMNFKFFIPVHATGLRAQGQNLGKLNFGYDLQLANSGSSSDVRHTEGFNFSYNASVHIRPVDGMRIMAGFNHDVLPNNEVGMHFHAGDSHSSHNQDYTGEVRMNQLHSSIAYFGNKWEFLNEFAYIQTRTDTLGKANNFTQYTYLGYRLKDKFVPYAMFDFIRMSANELHAKRCQGLKYALGMRWEIDAQVNLKFQLERYGRFDGIDDVAPGVRKYEVKFQLAYVL